MFRVMSALVLLVVLQPSPPARVYLPAVSASPDPLAAAATGLLYPSETDSVLVARSYGEPSPAAACAALDGRPRDARAVLDALVTNVGPEWTPLRIAVLALDAPLACRVGGVEGDIHLMGVDPSGRVVGVWAFVVET